ncbi:hypothetical protein [uncultured Psychroserpens sp.]|uniref:hypothetical protein n=1 Tax=uncultured Psychroserpens sp. TaxID=255436 RepID=UPI00261B2256|nr:hypothetical protein [uncultured Psychroserpens sp.]
MKKRRIKIGFLILTLIILFYILITNSKLGSIVIQNIDRHQVSQIDKNTLGKIYDAYRFKNYFGSNNKKEFLEYVKTYDKVLYKQLQNNKIDLYALPKSRNYYDFEGVFYYGLKLSNDGSFDSIDQPIHVFNSQKYKLNTIYGISDNEITPLKNISIFKLASELMPCKIENIKTVFNDTIYDNNYPEFKFLIKSEKDIQYSNDIDQKLLNKILKDPFFSEFSEKYDGVFLQFFYEPLEKFYCNDR